MAIEGMTRTPFGGMNQDDSIVTPTKDEAGRNSFQVGDYRYALNARIGSSRDDNFGDLENIRNTLEVTQYYAITQVLDNGTFDQSLDSWDQLDEGPTFRTWIFSGDYARLAVIPNSVSPILTTPVTQFTEPSHPDWEPETFTQAWVLNANSFFSVGETVFFQDAPDYTAGFIVAITSTYFVFQHTFNGDNPGASVEYGVGPPAYVDTTFMSRVLYQTATAPIEGLEFTLSFAMNINAAITDGILNLVYLTGTTIHSEVAIDSGNIQSITQTMQITVPAGVDGLGIRIGGTVNQELNADLLYFRLSSFSFAPTTRPEGNEKVIGRLEDYEFQRVYYCVYNDQNNHCIRYWNAVNNTIVEVLNWSGLNFTIDSFISMAKLDNWMAIAARGYSPRLMDVDTIAQLRSELGDDFREFHISFHKWSPIAPPIPRAYYDGSTNNYDKLKDKLYHFSYRYIYYGDLKSRWSPISKGATVFNLDEPYPEDTITSIQIDIPGCIYDDPNATGTEYNFFGHDDIKFQLAVKTIEIAFRDGELELWKLWRRIPVDVSFERLQYFDGKGILTPIAQDEFTRPFDTVPFEAGTVEAIDNRFVFGDCLEEKEPITNLQIDDVSSVYGIDTWNDGSTGAFPTIEAAARLRLQRFNALSHLTFKDRTLIKCCIQYLAETGWRTAGYTSEEWLYTIPDISGAAGTQNVALNFKIPDAVVPPDWAVGYQIMRTNSLNISCYMFGIVNRFTPIIDDISTIIDKLELPQNVRDRINEHFLNAQNITSDEVIAETTKIVEAEIQANKKKDRKTKRRNTLLRINRALEMSGTSTQSHSVLLEKWLRKNPIGPKLQAELRKTKEISAIADASRIHIDINNWYFGAKEAQNKEYPLNNLIYNFARGDRVRFIGSTSANPNNVNQLQEYDVPIIEFTGKGIIIEKPLGLRWVPRFDNTTLQNLNIEVYTPHNADESDHLFYEMGEWYPILYPKTGDRDFAKRDFVYTNVNAITLSQFGPFDIYNKMPVYFGDSYNVGKTVYRDKYAPAAPLPLGSASSQIFMSMNPDLNKTFDFWDKNNGRPTIAYEDLPVVRFKQTQCRFSGKIVEESFVNNINTMREEDLFVYPSEYGRIRAIVNTSNAQVESVGAILLVIGERQTWSTYVNRTTLEDLSGRSQVSLSEDVLGSFNTLLGDHGTLNPESICKQRGRVWFWDAIDGAWIRYGRDGLTEISKYKMRNWFSELGDLMITKYQTSEKPIALAEFDKFNDELITFQDHSTLPSTFRGYANYKGSLFSEEDKRWKSCHNFLPEMMSKMNKQVLMFKDGSPFLYEKGEGYSEFFGTKYEVMWEPVFNDNAHLKKKWQAFANVATDKWSVERILSEYRGLKAKQETRIKLNKFAEREDNFYAEIQRDINTPNGGVRAIVEGYMMRSKAIQVLMQLDPAVVHLSLLHYVMAEVTDSPKNP